MSYYLWYGVKICTGHNENRAEICTNYVEKGVKICPAPKLSYIQMSKIQPEGSVYCNFNHENRHMKNLKLPLNVTFSALSSDITFIDQDFNYFSCHYPFKKEYMRELKIIPPLIQLNTNEYV